MFANSNETFSNLVSPDSETVATTTIIVEPNTQKDTTFDIFDEMKMKERQIELELFKNNVNRKILQDKMNGLYKNRPKKQEMVDRGILKESLLDRKATVQLLEKFLHSRVSKEELMAQGIFKNPKTNKNEEMTETLEIPILEDFSSTNSERNILSSVDQNTNSVSKSPLSQPFIPPKVTYNTDSKTTSRKNFGRSLSMNSLANKSISFPSIRNGHPKLQRTSTNANLHSKSTSLSTFSNTISLRPPMSKKNTSNSSRPTRPSSASSLTNSRPSSAPLRTNSRPSSTSSRIISRPSRSLARSSKPFSLKPNFSPLNSKPGVSQFPKKDVSLPKPSTGKAKKTEILTLRQPANKNSFEANSANGSNLKVNQEMVETTTNNSKVDFQEFKSNLE